MTRIDFLRNLAAEAREDAHTETDAGRQARAFLAADALRDAADALALVEAARGVPGLPFWSEGTVPGRGRAGLTLGDTEHGLVSHHPTATDARRVLARRLVATALALMEDDRG